VLAIFGYVVKIEVFSEGKTEKRILFASGFAFERLTFLSKFETRLKRGRFCVKISQEKVSLNFKERLDNGNLWFLPFLFSMAL